MKKVILVLLTVALVLSCCACGNPKETEPDKYTEPVKPATETISITKSNFKNYFYIEYSQNEELIAVDGILVRHSIDFPISISQRVSGDISNVTVTLRVSLFGDFWLDDEKSTDITLNIPVSGSAKTSLTFESDWGLKELVEEPLIQVAVIDATGTIKVSN